MSCRDGREAPCPGHGNSEIFSPCEERLGAELGAKMTMGLRAVRVANRLFSEWALRERITSGGEIFIRGRNRPWSASWRRNGFRS